MLAALALCVALPAPASAAIGLGSPALHAAGGTIEVVLSSDRAQRVRAFGTIDGDVATTVRELRLRAGETRRVALPLVEAGRAALRRCAGRGIGVVAVRDRGTRRAPGPAVRAEAGRDPGDCRPTDVRHPPRAVDERCDAIDPAVCLYPFPNDRFTVLDPSTDTGRRVNLDVASMPRNVAGVPIDPTEWNRNDGFSPGSLVVTKVPGLDSPEAFERTGAVPIDDMARAYERAAPVVVVNARTRARHLVWAELDANPEDPADVTLLVRPGVNFAEGERYVVALRRLRDASGDELPATGVFRAYRDGRPGGDRRSRAHEEDLFRTLAEAGIGREDLYRAWDFTVASERSLTERMRFIRDDAFAQLGDTDLADLEVEGASPAFAVDEVIDDPDGPEGRIARRVEGTITVPCYLDLPRCVSGGRFRWTRAHGTPTPVPGSTTRARFRCHIPRTVVGGPPARAGIYGHGLLGSRNEVGQGQLQALGSEFGFVFCATDWIGMACADTDVPPDADSITRLLGDVVAGRFTRLPNCDIPNVASILLDASSFATLADRVQQGMLNFLYLGRAMIHPDGLSTDPAFQMGGRSVIDTSRLYYDGNSQGGIIGGALVAVAPDLDRGVLGVPGMNYSTLLSRSVDFDTYAQVLYNAYPDELERPLLFGLLQMLWDRAEANGYAHHMTSDPIANTPAHEVMLHVALGDHQVAQVSAEVEARTIGAHARTPWADPGRDADVDGIFGVPPIGRYPFAGSAIVLFDSGPLRDEDGGSRGTPVPPNTNVPPRAGNDPHEHPRRTAAARRFKNWFFRPGGLVVDACPASRPCYADTWEGPAR